MRSRSGWPCSTCCALLAEEGPVLVALDDVQWLDPASAGALQIAFRRLRDEPSACWQRCARRPDVAAPFEFDRSFPRRAAERLSLGPLSLGALHDLLEERLGLELTRPELARVQEATAGNPFFALELGRELVRTDTRPAAGQALRVPESLRELLGGRLARLPGETLDVLLQVAALARPTVELVAAAHGDAKRVLDGARGGCREGVVELDDSRIRFSTPLLASICYEQAPSGSGAPFTGRSPAAVSDVEERARHLALAADGPDAVVASDLDAAAEHAAARGAPARLPSSSELAADLTPADPVRSRRQRACGRRTSTASPATASGRSRCSSSCSTRFRPASSAPTCSSRSPRRSAPNLGRRRSSSATRRSPRRRGDDARIAADPGSPEPRPRCSLATSRAALADARAALEKAERVGDPGCSSRRDRATWGRPRRGRPRSLPASSSAASRSRSASGSSLEYPESPRVALARLLMRRARSNAPARSSRSSRRRRRREATRTRAGMHAGS